MNYLKFGKFTDALNPKTGVASTLLTGLNGYWKLDEATGIGTFADSSGLGNTLTAVNTPVGSAGLINNAMVCVTASNQYATRASTASLQTGDIDFFVDGFFQISSLATYSALVSKSDGTVAGSEYLLYFDQPGQRFQFTYYFSAGSSSSLVASTFGLPVINTWYYIAAWHNSVANTVNISVNNGTVDSVGHTLGVNSTSSVFSIGAQGAGGLPLGGKGDEVGFWKKVPTAGEITTRYNAGAGKSHPF